MSLRDLLSFNLFLQFTDGLISYQAFALGAIEANPVVAAAIGNWGNGLGTNLQQGFRVPTAAPDIYAEPQPTLTGNAGIERDGFGLCVRYYGLSLGTLAIGSLNLRRTHLKSRRFYSLEASASRHRSTSLRILTLPFLHLLGLQTRA
jgi:hypothetical protein